MSRAPSEPGEEAEKDPLDVLREVRVALATVFHDANNPLAIISGNAQYLVELSRMMDLDEDLVQPIHDIEEASRRVADKLRDLAVLRERVAKYVEEAEKADKPVKA